MIAGYENYFVVFKIVNGVQKYFQSVNKRIQSGYFWEELFFFATENEIFLFVSDFILEGIFLELASYET